MKISQFMIISVFAGISMASLMHSSTEQAAQATQLLAKEVISAWQHTRNPHLTKIKTYIAQGANVNTTINWNNTSGAPLHFLINLAVILNIMNKIFQPTIAVINAIVNAGVIVTQKDLLLAQSIPQLVTLLQTALNKQNAAAALQKEIEEMNEANAAQWNLRSMNK